jgi:cytoskeleton protein RodZ
MSTSTTEHKKDENMGSFGERMRREREMRGIKLEEISESTKISQRNLLALEDEHFERLPGGIFNKGFVRAYARYLGLDEEQAVHDFMIASANYDQPAALQPPGAEVSLVKPPVIPSEGSERRKDLAWALAALLVLAAGAAGWYRLNHSTKNSASSNISSTPALPRIPLPSSGNVGSTTESAGIGSEATQAANGVSGALVLAVRANQESWVSMVVDGKPYMDQVLVPGNEQMVRAREKIVLKTGNAGGLQISYNGKALAPLGKGGQVRTVTFTSTGIQQ